MVEFPNHGLRDQLRVCKSTEMKPITTLASEKACNPFLRCRSAEIRKHLGMETADETAVFAELRRRKDHF